MNYRHGVPDSMMFGRRLRHHRKRRGLTLAQLGAAVGKQASYLSLLENGKREVRLSFVDELAAALEVSTEELLQQEAPDRRSALEVELERVQRESLYQSLGLAHLKPSATVPDIALEHVVELYRRLHDRRSEAADAGEARVASVALREHLTEADGYLTDVERVAASALDAVGHESRRGVSQGELTDLARYLGFTIHQVQELPVSVRSVTDTRAMRIYIPQRDSLRTRAARAVVLQTLGHFALGHTDPGDFTEYLRQRMEASYFAGAVLLPESAALPFLERAKDDRDLSVEDLREIFYVPYEMAAHRFTNLATRHLGIRTHLVRSDEGGVVWKAYANDGLPLPIDPIGATIGQRVCREWGARRAFRSEDKFALHYQYTDTPAGTFWCGSFVQVDRAPTDVITIGTPLESARYFRGSDTRNRAVSRCPAPGCCHRPSDDLTDRWADVTWPSPRTPSHVVAALSSGPFPGVDITEVYEFLDRQ